MQEIHEPMVIERMERIPPKEMAKKLVRLIRPQRPDYQYLKKVFEHTRNLLGQAVSVQNQKREKCLPELLTDEELVSFYEAVWQARNRTHMVRMLTLVAYKFVLNKGKGKRIATFRFRQAFEEK